MAAAQPGEHYEIAHCGTRLAWAKLLMLDAAVKLLQGTLIEEKTPTRFLSDPSEDSINPQAAEAA